MTVAAESAVSELPERWEPPLPTSRGPITERLFKALTGGPGDLGEIPSIEGDPLSDDDLHLALYVCYELHYRGFSGVDARWEWNPTLLNLRRQLEEVFESALLERFGGEAKPDPSDVKLKLNQIAGQPGPPLSKYLRDKASLAEFRDYIIHRSAYRLKEGDPHSWVIPRLEGKAKAALVEIEFDEYGCGRAERIHAVLFRVTMDAMGFDSRYGAYLDLIPGVTLAPSNLMSMFGLHRRLRGAAVGHLVIAEMTSALSNKYQAEGLRRLGYGADATGFFDEHVIADSVHDMVALHELAGGLLAQDPSLGGDILFGASAGTGLDAAFAQYMLDQWSSMGPSLHTPATRPASLSCGVTGSEGSPGP
ncbi:MAG: iron-containing redox enzyme family protein [Pseudonocardiaceae bacterium]